MDLIKAADSKSRWLLKPETIRKSTRETQSKGAAHFTSTQAACCLATATVTSFHLLMLDNQSQMKYLHNSSATQSILARTSESIFTTRWWISQDFIAAAIVSSNLSRSRCLVTRPQGVISGIKRTKTNKKSQKRIVKLSYKFQSMLRRLKMITTILAAIFS